MIILGVIGLVLILLMNWLLSFTLCWKLFNVRRVNIDITDFLFVLMAVQLHLIFYVHLLGLLAREHDHPLLGHFLFHFLEVFQIVFHVGLRLVGLPLLHRLPLQEHQTRLASALTFLSLGLTSWRA